MSGQVSWSGAESLLTRLGAQVVRVSKGLVSSCCEQLRVKNQVFACSKMIQATTVNSEQELPSSTRSAGVDADSTLTASSIDTIAAAAAPPFQKLRGEENWEDWKMLMELHLGNLFDCILQDPAPEAMRARDSAEFQRDLQARTRILFSMEESLLRYVRGANTAHQVWTRLCLAFDDKLSKNRIALLKKLIGLRQKTTLAAYVVEFRDVLQQITATGLEIDDMVSTVLLMTHVKEQHRQVCELLERTCVKRRQNGTVTVSFDQVAEGLLREAEALPVDDADEDQDDKVKAEAAEPSDPLPPPVTVESTSSQNVFPRSEPLSDPRLKRFHPYQQRVVQPKAPKYYCPPSFRNKKRNDYPPCYYCSKTNHLEENCHFRSKDSRKKHFALRKSSSGRRQEANMSKGWSMPKSNEHKPNIKAEPTTY